MHFALYAGYSSEVRQNPLTLSHEGLTEIGIRLYAHFPLLKNPQGIASVGPHGVGDGRIRSYGDIRSAVRSEWDIFRA